MSEFNEPNFPGIVIDPKEARQFDRDLLNVLSQMGFNLLGILDKGISLDDNMDAAVVTFTSNASPDTEDTIAHTLGKIPTHFYVTSLDKAAVVYVSGTAFTKDNIFLKTSVASTAVKLILL